MEIARAAAALFVKQGLRATRAEDIAQAAGIAPRTFYRYFATKEEAVAPLYAAGADRWTEAVRTAPPELPVPQALEHAARHTLSPGAGVSAPSWQWVRTLVRLADSSPALRKVWAQVCHEAEVRLAEVLAGRTDDNVADTVPAPSPSLRFAAAVAAASVRVAVETWAADDAPAQGPMGPAALAMSNLAALSDFPWEDITARAHPA
ncbi:TetR/AcrR family transcriptional regulator [Streptomyces regalis]|uniref:TetR family transcriptional regulator n=1 Tax=Streptomyces regalis TaxID=68262 RepID=A0A0X3V4I9_9ACTN|nr:TetR family transcriptional regulator [Streptomyces regalis]KUL39142.1 TetR family transcriptional regulator [Streptomyces regalis]